MSELRSEIQAIKVEYICDECGKAKMIHFGLALLSNPPQYPHRCEECGAEKNLLSIYPLIEYRSS